MSLDQSPTHRTRQLVTARRKHPHPFLPSTGHPDLCAACNSGRDEVHRGQHVHTRATITERTAS